MASNAGLDDTLTAGVDVGHTDHHEIIHEAINELLSVDAVSPASAGTVTPDLHVATTLTVNMPAGNVTVGPVAASGAIDPFPGQRLVIIVVQDATGGRSVTWDASYGDPPPINYGASAATVCEFVNTAARGATAVWRAVGRTPPPVAYAASKVYASGQRVIGSAPYYGVWECAVTHAAGAGAFPGWTGALWRWVGGNGIGTTGQMPDPTAGPDGWRYYDTTLVAWSTLIAGDYVDDPPGSGQLAAGPVLLTSTFDIQACGTTFTDVTGASLSLPASTARGILVCAELAIVAADGTAAVTTQETPQLRILDGASAMPPNGPAVDGSTIAAVDAAVSMSHNRRLRVLGYFAPPVSAQTAKLQARLRNAAISGWTSCNNLPAFGTGGGTGDMLYAVYL